MQCFDGLAWDIYPKLRFESTRLFNAKDCIEMVTNQEYVKTIFVLKYR